MIPYTLLPFLSDTLDEFVDIMYGGNNGVTVFAQNLVIGMDGVKAQRLQSLQILGGIFHALKGFFHNGGIGERDRGSLGGDGFHDLFRGSLREAHRYHGELPRCGKAPSWWLRLQSP